MASGSWVLPSSLHPAHTYLGNESIYKPSSNYPNLRVSYKIISHLKFFESQLSPTDSLSHIQGMESLCKDGRQVHPLIRAWKWWQLVEKEKVDRYLQMCLAESTPSYLRVKFPFFFHSSVTWLPSPAVALFPLVDCFTSKRAHYCFSQACALWIEHIPTTTFRIQVFTFRTRNVCKTKKAEKKYN